MSDTGQEQRDSKTRRGILIAYAVITLIGAAFFVGSFEYSLYRGENQVGPAVLPRYVSGLLVFLGVLLVIQEVRVGSRLAGDSGIETETSSLTPKTIRKLLIVFGVMILTLILVPLLGLLPSLVLLIPLLTIWVERMPVMTSLIVTLVAAMAAYLIFIVFLRVPMPWGALEGVL